MDLIDKNIDNLISTDSAKIGDDSLKENAEFAAKAGLEVRVSRVYDGVGLSRGRVCEWCKSRECDNVSLEEAYRIGAFQRHPGCECVIEYTSRKGERTRQSGKSGRSGWITVEEFEQRVAFGLDKRKVSPQERIINAAIEMQAKDKKSDTLVNAIVDNHKALSLFSPEEMKRRLEQAGFVLETLDKSEHGFEHLTLEEGGGFITHFADGVFLFLPAGGGHGIAYWKIRNGNRGKHWYDTEGIEFNPRKRHR